MPQLRGNEPILGLNSFCFLSSTTLLFYLSLLVSSLDLLLFSPPLQLLPRPFLLIPPGCWLPFGLAEDYK
jgi:hypothetical protein